MGEEDDLSAAQRAVVEAFVVLAGSSVGGTEGAVGAALLAPLAVEAAGRALTELRDELRHSPVRVIQGASNKLGIEPDEVVTRGLATEQGTQLLTDALTSALRTVNERKINGFARALAMGLLGDEARVNDAQIIIRALAELEEPHIRLLGRVVEESPGHGRVAFSLQHLAAMANSEAAGGAIVATLERVGILSPDDEKRREAEAEQVRQAFERQRAIERSGAARAALSGRRPGGTTESPVVGPIESISMWAISDFGRVCWEHLTTPVAGRNKPDGGGPPHGS